MGNLSEAIQNTNSFLNQINDQINGLKKSLIGRKVTAKLEENFKKFELRLQDHVNAYESDADFDRLMKTASHCVVYSNAIIAELNKTDFVNDLQIKSILGKLSTMTSMAKQSIEQREVVFGNDEALSEGSRSAVSLLKESERLENINQLISRMRNDISLVESRQQKRELSVEKTIANLEERTETLVKDIQQRLDQVDKLYDSSKSELARRKVEVNELLETISGDVIAGDYQKSAANEKEMADWLRYGSLFCMLLITLLVGYSFYESISPDFDWKIALLRLPFTLILSIPAAYLAKESSKHRLQQYLHLQTSLDLKAINPYLSTLPSDDQNRIKSEIANRLFAARDFSSTSSDSYPINTQELIKILLKNFEINKAESLGKKVQ